jgi:hypothetical protein
MIKSDFEICKKDLTLKYPDIAKYEERFRWDYSEELPKIDHVYSSLGIPHQSETSWKSYTGLIIGGIIGASMAGVEGIIGGIILFGPQHIASNVVVNKEWKIGNYDIKAQVFYPAEVLYEGRLSYFSWTEVETRKCT